MVEAIIRDKSRAKMLQETGGQDWLRRLLELDTWDLVEVEDDFHGVGVDARWGAVVTGTDGSIDKVAGAVNGEVTLDVGDGGTSDDDEYGGWPLTGLEWKGDLNAVMAVRLKLSAITTIKVEVGFTDAISGDAGAVLDLAADTRTADNAAVWIIDVPDDTATWQGTGVKATTVAAGGKIEDTGIAAPVAGAYQTLVVALQGDNAKFLQFNANGKKIYESNWMADAIEGGTLIVPWVFVQNRANTIDRLITMIEPPTRIGRIDAKSVITGITELRSACLYTTTRSLSPLARAVRM